MNLFLISTLVSITIYLLAVTLVVIELFNINEYQSTGEMDETLLKISEVLLWFFAAVLILIGFITFITSRQIRDLVVKGELQKLKSRTKPVI